MGTYYDQIQKYGNLSNIIKKQSSILVVGYWVQVNLKSAIQIWKNKQLYRCTECQDLRFKVLFKYQYQLIVEIRRVHTFSKK